MNTAMVVIADDRPGWMIKEDKLMTCLVKCKRHRKCSSRYGIDCKVLGGTQIPKFRR